MAILSLILLLIGFVCFGAAAFNAPTKVNLTAVGLACWILVSLLTHIQP